MSSSDFHSQRLIKATRKPHECQQCGKEIVAGSAAEYGSGMYDGYLYSTYNHVECHNAAWEYAEKNGLWGEDWPWFRDMENSEQEHHSWLLKNHPVVAARLGIKETEDA